MHNISTDMARLYLCILCTLLRCTEFPKKMWQYKVQKLLWRDVVALSEEWTTFFPQEVKTNIYVKREFQGWCGINLKIKSNCWLKSKDWTLKVTFLLDSSESCCLTENIADALCILDSMCQWTGLFCASLLGAGVWFICYCVSVSVSVALQSVIMLLHIMVGFGSIVVCVSAVKVSCKPHSVCSLENIFL